jgi:hypothetical protein
MKNLKILKFHRFSSNDAIRVGLKIQNFKIKIYDAEVALRHSDNFKMFNDFSENVESTRIFQNPKEVLVFDSF